MCKLLPDAGVLHRIRFEQLPPFKPTSVREQKVAYLESALREWQGRDKPDFLGFKIGDEPFNFVNNSDGTCCLVTLDERLWKDYSKPSIPLDPVSPL